MYECPNCSGGLKFNIAAQKLSCENCDSQFDPYSFEGPKMAEEDQLYDVNVFTCSQCGGELYTTDTTMTGFCSFCGSPTILESRVEKEFCPDYIIPFAKTKEECKDAYMKMMRMAIFAPKELKNRECIDRFCGIYMPYWLYDVNCKGHLSLSGEREEKNGDYIITYHYRMRGDLDAKYRGISYDGSSSFADNISEKIAPYDVKNMKEFTPAYLSGFYADTSDVDVELYRDEAMKFAEDKTADYVIHDKMFSQYNVKDSGELRSCLKEELESNKRAMFPVWFMSYRNGDRVAYAAVNGQTGKVVADLPVDIKKYLIGTLILAIPIFVLLNMFLTVTPSVLLAIISIFSAGVAILHALEMKEIWKRDRYFDDKGMQYNFNNGTATEEKNNPKRKGKFLAKIKKLSPSTWVVIGMLAFFVALPSLMSIIDILNQDLPIFLPVLSAEIIAAVAFWKSMTYAHKLDRQAKVSACIYSLVSVGVALMIAMLQPAHDGFYYAGVIVALAALYVTLADLIKKYNVLATRRLPQFDRQGGDDNA